MKKGKIAVTPRSISRNGHPALKALEQAGYEIIYPAPGKQPTIGDLKKFLPECVGYLAGVEPIPAEVIKMCQKLKVISRNGVGIDNVDLAAAQAQGIAVEKAMGANSRSVAELTIALMLAGLRHVPWSDQQIKQNSWQRREGIEVLGRTMGLIGCGQIGQYVSGMALGLGMKVRAYDLYPDCNFKPDGDFGFVTLEQVLCVSDVISLHCPVGEHPMIDVDSIKKMKPNAYLINTARSALVNHEAVLDALEAGHLRGFATDVYDHEPPESTPLLRHDRVITSPHAGGLTEESIQRATEAAVQNLLKVLNLTL